MTYIIENANVVKKGELVRNSYLVEDDVIRSVKTAFPKYRHMKMDASPYIMTPSYVLYMKELPVYKSIKETKQFYLNDFILKGCLVFLTTVSVRFKHHLRPELNRLRTKLLNCPVDYIIGVRISVRLLQPDFIRQLKREKVPAIFIEVKHEKELDEVPWGWVKEASFPYHCPFIPIFLTEDSKERKRLKSKWNEVMENNKLPSVDDELKHAQPIPYPTQAKIGIYPLKSNLQAGFELTYNFYSYSREITKIEELDLYHYHRERLVISVLRGKVIRAGNAVAFKPGFGEQVTINTPSYYQLLE